MKKLYAVAAFILWCSSTWAAGATRVELIRAIKADPDNDSLRLNLAGWLDTNGEPEMAEFIRVQVSLANLEPGDPTRGPLQEREAALLPTLKLKIIPTEIRGSLKIENDAFRRGLLENLQMRPQAVLDAKEDLFNEESLVIGITLKEFPRKNEVIQGLIASGRLERVSLIGLDGLGAAQLQLFAASDLVDRVDSIYMNQLDFRTKEFMDALMAFKRLRTLSLQPVWRHDLPFGDAELTRILSQEWPRLSTLMIPHSQIRGSSIEILARTTNLPRLRHLDLGWALIDDAAILAMANAETSRKFRFLKLGRLVKDSVIEAVMGSPNLIHVFNSPAWNGISDEKWQSRPILKSLCAKLGG